MEFVVELFFTASLSLCLAYVIVHLVSKAGYVGGASIEDELDQFAEKSSEKVEEKDCSCSGLDDHKDVILVKDDEELDEKSLEEAEILLRKVNSEEISSNFEETDVKSDEGIIPVEQLQVEEIELKLEALDHDDQRVEDDVLDDDWEGIEKSEEDKLFSCASKFVGNIENSRLLANLGNEVLMQLYGLHKVAMEGPCREQAPMALMVSARAKWNAWQRLGNMSPEMAMEQYVTLLSGAIPCWMGENHQSDKDIVVSGAGESRTEAHENMVVDHQPVLRIDRKPEELQSLGENRDTESL
ncbi:hypothetical protein ACHQM5_024991 [Ranunculus cassubicifolius]